MDSESKETQGIGDNRRFTRNSLITKGWILNIEGKIHILQWHCFTIYTRQEKFTQMVWKKNSKYQYKLINSVEIWYRDRRGASRILHVSLMAVLNELEI